MSTRTTRTINVRTITHRRAKVVAARRGEDLGVFTDRVLSHYCTEEEKLEELRMLSDIKKLTELKKNGNRPTAKFQTSLLSTSR